MRVVGGAERHADRTVLGEDYTLLVGRQLRELAASPQRIPDRPRPLRIEY